LKEIIDAPSENTVLSSGLFWGCVLTLLFHWLALRLPDNPMLTSCLLTS